MCIVSGDRVALFSRGQCEYTNLSHITDYVRSVVSARRLRSPVPATDEFSKDIDADGL